MASFITESKNKSKQNMATYMNNTAIVDNINESYSKYSKFLGTAPLLVTYLKQDEVLSTTDVGMGNIMTGIGDASPTKYSKINNLPLWIDPSTPSIDNDDDYGLEISWESEGVLAPDTITPIAHDYLLIHTLSKQFLFKITEVQFSCIKSNEFWKINFKLDKEFDKSFLQSITDEYECIYENIGTTDSAIIKSSDLISLETISKCCDEVANQFLDMYYNPSADIPVIYNNKYFIVDPFLIEFTRRTKLFEIDGSINGKRFIHPYPLANNFKRSYNKTIFAMVEKGNIFDWETRVGHIGASYSNNYLESNGSDARVLDYYDTRYSDTVLCNYTHNPLEFSSLTYSAVVDNVELENDLSVAQSFMVNTIIKFINGGSASSIALYISNYINSAEDIFIDDTSEDIYVTAIFIYVLKQCAKDMVKKHNNDKILT